MTIPSHLIISTHTTRHLETVLKGVALLTPAPTTVSLTCDVDQPEIEQLAASCAKRFNLTIHYTARKHHGIMRLSQVRNNGVRTLMDQGHSNGILLFIDGDMVLSPDSISKHINLAKQYDVVACERFNLSENKTQYFSENLMDDKFDDIRTEDEIKRLKKVDTQRRKNALLRRFGLTKPNKPKILGCHFALRFEAFVAINGLDEGYEGFGGEDDDLARRVHKQGLRYHSATIDIPAYHLYHPTQAISKWESNPGSIRFMSKPWEAQCNLGLSSPVPQNMLNVKILSA